MGGGGLVTLLTDFGTRDSYVAEMKGAMLTVAPDLRFVDISHAVAPGDVAAGRYLLTRAWPEFPAGTVHLVVIDPGVGSERAALAAAANGHWFVGPDNGVLGPVLERGAVVRLPVPEDASATFHGRDVFGPAAARLATGAPVETLGEPFQAWTPGEVAAARHEGRMVVGEVIYVDRFGTLVTNLPAEAAAGRSTVVVGRAGVPLRRTFADVEPGALVGFVGSGQTVEIAVRNGSATAVLGVGVGAEVTIRN